MASVWGELKRRNVVKVAVAYAIVGWVLVQVADTFFPALQLPEWTVTFVAGLVILGFPLALILSWAYELTPEGMRRSHEIPVTESTTHVIGRKIDFAIIGALVLALGLVVYNYESGDEPGSEIAVDEVVDTAPLVVAEEQRAVLPNSVAVLPFRNDSPDPDNAYYASGIHEEILNQLVKLSALNVIARTSVEQYRNTEKSIPEIARELNVETVMEGSIRYDAGRIRITTQLNDGVTGAHLWSETYTRDFDDIFAIESDVAMNVANAVGAEFSLEEQASIEKIPTESLAAYALYLSALEARKSVAGADRAIQLLDRAIENDSDFALAHATKAHILGFRFVDEVSRAATNSFETAAEVAEQLERTVIEHAERALVLDPQLGLAHSALGLLHMRHWRKEQTEAEFARALTLSPKNSEILSWYSVFSSWTENHERAIDLARRAAVLNPRQGLADVSGNRSDPYFWAGNYDIAAQNFQDAVAARPNDANQYFYLAEVEAARANYGAAIENLRLFEQLIGYETAGWVARAAYVYSLSGRPDDAARVFALVEEQYAPASPMQLAVGHLATGDSEESLRLFREAAENRLPLGGSTLTILIKLNIYEDSVLEQPDFVEVRQRLGFTDL